MSTTEELGNVEVKKIQWYWLGAMLSVLLIPIMILLGGNNAAVAPQETETIEPTSVPNLGGGSTQISTADGMVQVYIPAGAFQMGSEDGDSDEDPVHEVYLDAYWMDEHEVTNAQFVEFLKDQGNQTEGSTIWLDVGDPDVLIEKSGGEWIPDSGYGDHPVVEVTWYGARAYCEWAGRRLPTEAEWEKTARGELEGKKYPWGDESPVCEAGAINGAQYYGCSGSTIPVKSYAPNGYGLYDMAGNVWEWAADWYDGDYYSSTPYENPQGPDDGTYRVLRGSSWLDNSDSLRVANRFGTNLDDSYYNVGFRCAASIP